MILVVVLSLLCYIIGADIPLVHNGTSVDGICPSVDFVTDSSTNTTCRPLTLADAMHSYQFILNRSEYSIVRNRSESISCSGTVSNIFGIAKDSASEIPYCNVYSIKTGYSADNNLFSKYWLKQNCTVHEIYTFFGGRRRDFDKIPLESKRHFKHLLKFPEKTNEPILLIHVAEERGYPEFHAHGLGIYPAFSTFRYQLNAALSRVRIVYNT